MLWFSVAVLASLSAVSLPRIPMWLGTKTSVTWLLVLWLRSIRSASRFGRLRARPLEKVAIELSESVKIANFLDVVVCSSYRVCSSARLMAVISPVWIVTPSERRALSSVAGDIVIGWI